MSTKIVKITPETLKTIYLRKENREIIRTESDEKIWINREVPIIFKPVRLYDLESQLNENKREILLVDRSYLDQIVKEFDRLIQDIE